MFLKLKDKRDVKILNTFHKREKDVKLPRRKKEVNIQKPLDDYKTKNGRSRQM
jgi:hypothetical protein